MEKNNDEENILSDVPLIKWNTLFIIAFFECALNSIQNLY